MPFETLTPIAQWRNQTKALICQQLASAGYPLIRVEAMRMIAPGLFVWTVSTPNTGKPITEVANELTAALSSLHAAIVGIQLFTRSIEVRVEIPTKQQ